MTLPKLGIYEADSDPFKYQIHTYMHIYTYVYVYMICNTMEIYSFYPSSLK